MQNLLQNRLRTFNSTTDKWEYHSFLPFIKILLKTPRYRYQENEGKYDLECKIRPICFAAHMDSLILGYYSYGLNERYQEYIKEHKFDHCVLAYRSDTGLCNIQYSKEVFDCIKHFNEEKGGCTAIALDIKGYFNHIDHKILKDKWSQVWDGSSQLPEEQFRIWKLLTNGSYINRNSLHRTFKIDQNKLRKKGLFPANLLDLIPGKNVKTKLGSLRDANLIVDNKPSLLNSSPKGIPQGSSISALLSNIYLVDYDKMMNDFAKAKGFIYRRYCDDIIIICETSMAEDLKKIAIAEIKQKYKLTIQEQKVETIDFMPDTTGNYRGFRRKKSEPNIAVQPNKQNQKVLYRSLQYLGFEFDGQTARIRPSSISRYFRKGKAKLDVMIGMAYGPNGHGDKVSRYQFYERYTHYGDRNFISYARNAAKREYLNRDGVLKDGHGSKAIRKQLKQHMKIFEHALKVKSRRRFFIKSYFQKNPVYKR